MMCMSIAFVGYDGRLQRTQRRRAQFARRAVLTANVAALRGYSAFLDTWLER